MVHYDNNIRQMHSKYNCLPLHMSPGKRKLIQRLDNTGCHSKITHMDINVTENDNKAEKLLARWQTQHQHQQLHNGMTTTITDTAGSFYSVMILYGCIFRIQNLVHRISCARFGTHLKTKELGQEHPWLRSPFLKTLDKLEGHLLHGA